MKIAITGAEGKVAQALIGQLDPQLFDITCLDLPEHDATDLGDLVRATSGHDILVHLAWKDLSVDSVDPSNKIMYENAYKAAVENSIGLVIMGSSNHARSHAEQEPDGKIRYTGHPETPNNIYGAEKQMMEAMGRRFADQEGLKIIAVRIGNINPEDKPRADVPTRWMSHYDFGRLITLAAMADFEPGHFEVVYGVSDQIVFDWKNSFGYAPEDRA